MQWGLNVVRCGFHWHRGEPTPGNYNLTYINELVNFVDILNQSGIYVILDMHQDCWSPLFCKNHGIPSSYSQPYNTSEYRPGGSRAYPEPVVKPKYNDQGHITNCVDVGKFVFGWASCYATYAVGSAAQQLYDNKENRLDKFGKFWALIASKVGHYPNVLGYELINEPWIGDVPLSLAQLEPTNPHWDLWFPKVADSTNMAGMYKILHDYIRNVDNKTILFFEPATGGNFLDAWPSGFESGPGGPEYNDRQALSYHIYCFAYKNNANDFFQWLIEHLDIAACDLLNDAMYDIRFRDTQRLGLAGFLTEFGNAGKGVVDKATIDFAAKKMDEFFHGWTYWYLTPDPQDSNTTEVRALVRPYPHSIAGVPYHMTFDPNQLHFELRWTPCTNDPCAHSPTEVFTSEQYHYPNGYQLSLTDGFNADKDPKKSMLYIHVSENTPIPPTARLTLQPI